MGYCWTSRKITSQLKGHYKQSCWKKVLEVFEVGGGVQVVHQTLDLVSPGRLGDVIRRWANWKKPLLRTANQRLSAWNLLAIVLESQAVHCLVFSSKDKRQSARFIFGLLFLPMVSFKSLAGRLSWKVDSVKILMVDFDSKGTSRKSHENWATDGCRNKYTNDSVEHGRTIFADKTTETHPQQYPKCELNLHLV